MWEAKGEENGKDEIEQGVEFLDRMFGVKGSKSMGSRLMHLHHSSRPHCLVGYGVGQMHDEWKPR